jgi:UDP-glucose 4-epimerase
MVTVVPGGAGFIGVNLVRRLLEDGPGEIVVIDNFIRGSLENLGDLVRHPSVHVIEADLSSRDECAAAFDRAREFGDVDEVWHLAANSDIPAGVADPDIDLRHTFLTTFEILLQMRRIGIRRLLFASSSAIYGDFEDEELREDMGPLFPISNYGAMKLASEAQAAAAGDSYLDQALLFRFPNVIGVPATHGVVLDFVRKLKADPSVLPVLGDGTQRKPYLHVSELIDAMLQARSRSRGGVAAYNIGPTDPGVTVRSIAERVVARVSPGAGIAFGHGAKGWAGDVSKFRYSIRRMKALGWRPSLDSAAAMDRAIDEIAIQEGVAPCAKL